MAVNRSGKYGRRAGGKKSKPASRNGRVRRNAFYRRITLTPDDRPSGNRTTKEQWVIATVSRIVGTRGGPGFVTADDIASDILLMLLDAGGFQWDEEEIEAFCLKKSAFMVHRYLGRRERNECEFQNREGDPFLLIAERGSVPPMQDIIVDAHDAQRRLLNIPDRQRAALEILCDGGNPINVAEELGIPPWEAITLIKEGREYVDRVDPL